MWSSAFKSMLFRGVAVDMTEVQSPSQFAPCCFASYCHHIVIKCKKTTDTNTWLQKLQAAWKILQQVWRMTKIAGCIAYWCTRISLCDSWGFFVGADSLTGNNSQKDNLLIAVQNLFQIVTNSLMPARITYEKSNPFVIAAATATA